MSVKKYPGAETSVVSFNFSRTIAATSTETESIPIGDGWNLAIIHMHQDASATTGSFQNRAVEVICTRNIDDGLGLSNKRVNVTFKSYMAGGTYTSTAYMWVGRSYLLDGSELTLNNYGNIGNIRFTSATIVGSNIDLEMTNTTTADRPVTMDGIIYLLNAKQL